MSGRVYLLVILLRVCALLGCVCSLPATASSDPIDVRLLIDVSAQMTVADPQAHRARAAGMLVRLLPGSASAGVWTYARYVNMMVKHGLVSPAWVETAIEQTAQFPAVGADANLLAAVEAATWDIDSKTPRAGSGAGAAEAGTRHLIIVSDGRLQTGAGREADRKARLELLGTRLDALVAAGFIVHGLQLPGADADAEDGLLRRMALVSGGLYLPVANLEALSAAFMKVFRVTVRPQLVPVRADGFQVDPGIDEFTVLRPRTAAEEDLRLFDPDGAILTRARLREGVRWHDAGRYDMVTVERPKPGRWHFSRTAGPGTEVYVVGDLELRLQGVPATVFPGMLKTFELQLRSHGELITDPDFLALLEIRASIAAATDQIPVIVETLEPGRYLLKLLALNEQGEHQVRVRVGGPTFSRELVAAFIVRNPVALQIVPAGEGTLAWLELNAADVEYQTLVITALTRRPPGAGRPVEVERLPAGLWKLPLQEGRGALELTIGIEGNYLNGSTFKLETDPIVMSTPLREPMEVNLDLSGAKIAAGPGSAAQGRPGAGSAGTHPFMPRENRATGSSGSDPASGEGSRASDTGPDNEESAPIPLWFAVVLGVLNLAIGLSVWVLLNVPQPADAFHAELVALQALLSPTDDTGSDGLEAAAPA